MATLINLGFSFLTVLLLPILFLPHLALCSETEDNLLQGLNSYRTANSLPQLSKNENAKCLAEEIAEKLEHEQCSNANKINIQQLPNYDESVHECKLDINTTRDAAIMPVCVRHLVPTLVLTNYTHSAYAKQLNDSKFTGAGVGSEDDWTVVILTTSTQAGSFAKGGGSVGYGEAWFGGVLLVNLFVGLMLFVN